MARFSVHRHRDGMLLIDCQADLLDSFSTRIVIPLLPRGDNPPRFERLHPQLTVDGDSYTLATHLLTAVPLSVLGKPVASLADDHNVIMNAIDMLLTGC